MLSLCAVMMLPVTSCSDKQDDPVVPVTEVRQAVFTINMGDAATFAGRATPTDGEYDAGSGLENFIDIDGGDYACYLFTSDNVLVSELMVSKIYKIDTSTTGRTYTITTNLRQFEVKAIEKGCKVAILANWGDYPEVQPGITTIESMCASAQTRMAYNPSKAVLSADNNKVPMYGIKSFTGGTLAEGEDTFRVGTVRLLRAYAKIDVNVLFDDFTDDAELAVTSVSLTNCYDGGYKMQAAKYALDESDYVHGSWFADYTPVHIPADAATFVLPLVKDDVTGHYIAYVPEYDNLGEAESPRPVGERARLRVDFAVNGQNHTGYIEFKYSNKNIDIARNNWYRFNATITAKHEVEFTVDVIPFSSVDLHPEFGVEREPLSGYSPVKNPDGTIDHWMDKWGNLWYLGNAKGELYATINGEQCLLAYTYPKRELSHWYDADGNMRTFAATDITSNKYIPVDIDGNGWPDWYLDENNRRVWLTPFRDANWYSPYYSQYVWTLEKYWDSANNTPDYWYDFMGNRHEMDELETEVLADWINFIN